MEDYVTYPEPLIPPPETRLTLPLAKPVLTYVLIAVNVLIYLLTLLTGDLLYILGALIPVLAFEYGQWWRLLSAAFLHAGLMHIAFNMYALYVLGRRLEQLFGTARFALIYGLALLGGSVFVMLFARWDSLGVGASGAILGLLGALVSYFWHYQKYLHDGRQQLWDLVSNALINLAIGFLPQVSLWAHLGGFAVGALVGWLLLPRYRLRDYQLQREPLPSAIWSRLALVLLGLLVSLPLAMLWRR